LLVADEYAANVGSPDGDYLRGPADQLNGASFQSDSRTSVDGAHSLRLIAPTAGGGFCGGPFPSSLINGTRYSMSVHAKAAAEGVVLDLAPGAGWKADGPAEFNLTTEWQRYEVNGTVTSSTKESVSQYTLTTGACNLAATRLLRHATWL